MDPEKNLIEFFLNDKVTSAENFFYSENRGEAAGRLSKVYTFLKTKNFSEPILSRMVACVGEILNNSFDHNLGYWNGKPGCVLGLWADQGTILMGIVDRGRGIVASLKSALEPSLKPKDILNAAFEKIVSGRAPEKRGNGLKFVRSQIQAFEKNSLFCFSAGEHYQVGPAFFKATVDMQKQKIGTFILLRWSSK